MPICGERQFDLVKKMSFTRVSTTPEETKAADILMRELAALSVSGSVETFPVPRYEIKTAKLSVLEPFQKDYTVTGYGLTGSTAPDGITAGFAYVENAKPANLVGVKGKIALVNRSASVEAYRDLLKAGAVGFITFGGNLWDDPEQTDLDVREVRAAQLQFGKLPGVHLRAAEALELVNRGASKVHMVLEQDEMTRDSRNVVAELQGTEYPDEIVCFTAHFDSVLFSTGAYDNATGSATLMELLRYYLENPPKRTLRFIWCGSEEVGLLGSKAYVKAHEGDLEKIRFVINVDLTGAVLGDDNALVMADESVCSMLRQLGDEVGFNINARQEVAPSDCTPFADQGVPGLSFGRYGCDGAGPIHNRHDTIDVLSAACLERTTKFICLFSQKLVNACVFPISRKLPDEWREKLDKYFKRDLTPAP